jgi:hypothetical protein
MDECTRLLVSRTFAVCCAKLLKDAVNVRDVQPPSTYSSKMYCLFMKVKWEMQYRETTVA